MEKILKELEKELKVDQEIKGYELLDGGELHCCPGDDCGYGYIKGIEKAIEIINNQS